MGISSNSPTRQLVLVGGGHSHLMVLESFISKPIAGLAITVVSRNPYTPYSGMMPGLIANHYDWEQCHIQLANLCHRAKATLIVAEISHIDPIKQLVHGDHLQPLLYDWLSLNIGSHNQIDNIPGAAYQGIAIKPIEQFLLNWKTKLSEILQHKQAYKIAVVGGGAASVELILAIDHCLRSKELNLKQKPKLLLITAAKQVLPQHSPRTQRLAEKILRRHKIALFTNHAVTEAHHYGLTLANGQSIAANCVMWATQAGAPEWLINSDISNDMNGFMKVNAYLQSCSNPNIFAAGDMINFNDQNLPKSGVHAIRAGLTLAKNLHNCIHNKKMIPYKPQKYFLSIISLGEKKAMASWGPWLWHGKWVWYWKNWLDKRFVTRLNKKL